MKKQAEHLISKKEQTMNKTSQKRRFGILFAAVGMICCFLAAALLAACNNQPAAQSGDEVGVYYYDDTDRNTQSLITLGQGCSFTLVLDDEAISGTYSLDGETLTLTQTDSKTLTATLRNDVITLTYENVQMRFLKKLYFTVTFDTTGGSEVEAVSVLNGKAVSKPVSDPTREGYVFLGWYTDAQFTSPYLFGAQPVTGDLTLYARWAQTTPGEAEYTISYDLGYDGEEIADSQTIGGKLYLPATPAAREGYPLCRLVGEHGERSRASLLPLRRVLFDGGRHAVQRGHDAVRRLAGGGCGIRHSRRQRLAAGDQLGIGRFGGISHLGDRARRNGTLHQSAHDQHDLPHHL